MKSHFGMGVIGKFASEYKLQNTFGPLLIIVKLLITRQLNFINYLFYSYII